MQESTRSTETRHQATVPDTIDLAERAALAVNALTAAADPAKGYETAACASVPTEPFESGRFLSAITGWF